MWLSQGDEDPFNSRQKITLYVGHIIAHKRMDDNEETESKILTTDDFITMCNVCNEGLKNKYFKRITYVR